MTFFSTFRFAALFAFSTFSAIAFAESSPIILPPQPSTNGGNVAISSPIILPPQPTTNGGNVAVSSPIILPPQPTTNGGTIAAE